MLAGGSVSRQNLEWDEELAARGVDRKCREQPGNGVREAGMANQHPGIDAAGENSCRERDKPGRHTLCIRFEIGQGAHRLVVEIESTRIEQCLKSLRRQLIARDGCEQRRCDRMALAAASQRVAPPLQPDLPRKRLAGHLAHACDFQIERVQRKERVPMLGGSKQSAEKAVLIGRADEPLAMGKRILHGALYGAPQAASRAITSAWRAAGWSVRAMWW